MGTRPVVYSSLFTAGAHHSHGIATSNAPEEVRFIRLLDIEFSLAHPKCSVNVRTERPRMTCKLAWKKLRMSWGERICFVPRSSYPLHGRLRREGLAQNLPTRS